MITLVDAALPTWKQIIDLYNRNSFFVAIVRDWQKHRGVNVIPFACELERRRLIATWILYAGYAIGTLITLLVLGFILIARDHGSYAQSNPNASAVAVVLILLVTFTWGIFYSVGRTLVLRWSAENTVMVSNATDFPRALQSLCTFAGKDIIPLFHLGERHIRDFAQEFPAVIAREILEEEAKEETIQTLRRRAELKAHLEHVHKDLEALGLVKGGYEPYFTLAKQQIAAEKPPVRGGMEFII